MVHDVFGMRQRFVVWSGLLLSGSLAISCGIDGTMGRLSPESAGATATGGASVNAGDASSGGRSAGPAVACGATIIFDGLPTQATGTDPESVTAGDWDGDGNQDLATANHAANSVSVLLGNGDGSFQPKKDFASGPGPSVIVSGDWNNDGNLDLLTVNTDENAQSISILLGNGDGSFQPKSDQIVPADAWLATSGDWNGDGKADLAFVHASSTSLNMNWASIWLGNGDGSFALDREYMVPYAVQSIVLADVNNDDNRDLVVGSLAGVSVLFGKRDGSFSEASTPMGGPTVSIATADFNGDGRSDVAAYYGCERSESAFVRILLTRASGDFEQVAQYPARGCTATLAAADVNGDGAMDVISSEETVLLGNGDGTFSGVRYGSSQATSSSTLALGDWNHDGKLDRASLNPAHDFAAVRLGNGDGTFGTKVDYESGFATRIADVNGDGAPDLLTIATSGSPSSLGVLLGNGDGSFMPQLSYPTGEDPHAMAVGDLNGDGALDVVSVTIAGASVLLGAGDGSFGPKRDCITASTQNGTNSLALVDVTADGILDIITTGFDHGLSVLPGKGDGTFAQRVDHGFDLQVLLLAVSDLNGDGRPDLVLKRSEQSITILLGQSDGSFGSSWDLPLERDFQSIAIGDLNEDGKPDIVTDATGWSILPDWVPALTVLLGNGDGTFRTGGEYQVANLATVALGDLNGDGHLDAAVTDHALHVLFGAGDGTLSCTQEIVGVLPTSLLFGDLNGDHKADLVATGATTDWDTISVFLSPR